jgi:imidazolonepropionase-like amidohydrolase/Tol biopolymer transport system component
MKKLFTSVMLMTFVYGLTAQKQPGWDVNTPPGEFKEIEYTTDEGTWMSLDVSPDGKEIIFDMMGDIYSMPMTGGNAKVLRQGHAFEVQPRFSPDGKRISFTSDAGGGDNIWVMNRDGSDAKQITKEKFRLLNNSYWMPDGDYLVAKKHFSSGRSLGAGEIWMYHTSGGSGEQLTKRKNDQQDVGEPCVSPDGRYIYYSEDVYPGGFFQYNKDPNSQIYVINRYDREKGTSERVTGGPGGAIRPQISNNGNLMAFVKRVRTKTVLYIHDLKSGKEWPIFDDLSKDQQEAWAIFGPYTGFDWTPDDQNIIIYAKGKIRKVNVSTATSEVIPFSATAKHKITNALKFENKAFEEKFTSKAIRHAVTSPDGKQLIFHSAGYLYSKTLPNGTPKRLTKGNDFEFEPAFSSDGNSLVYGTWSDVDLGAIFTMDLKSKKTQKVTPSKGIFRTPQYSPNGRMVVFQKESGNSDQGFDFTKETGIYTIPVTGGEMKLITSSGAFPRFSADGKRIFFQSGGYLFGSIEKEYKSTNLNGADEKVHFKGDHANFFMPSPDNKWIAFMELFKVYVAPMNLNGKTLKLSAATKAIPVAQVAKDAGINLHWSGDSKKIRWTLGDEYFSTEIKNRFGFIDNKADSLLSMDTVGVKIGMVHHTDKPSGELAFTGARLITMDGDQVIEDGVIVVKDNMISAVGAKDQVTIPKGAKVIDVNGKTIMPGIVDAHAHVRGFRYGILPQQNWAFMANLAYGVTTAHDPSANTESIFTSAEMIKSGQLVGPRLYSTGVILYGAEGDFKAVINNVDDARSAIRRTKAFGAFSVKSYNQPRREQRQQVITAAREQNVLVVPEGGSTYFHNMSMILDGHTGIEHNVPVYPLYKDVTEVWKNSQTGYTPTLIVNYASITGEFYWYQTTNVWENEKLLTFTPRGIIDARSRHRTMIPMEEYEAGHILASKTCKALTDAGVKVNVGAHGQLQGLGAHWELWMLAQGGMTSLEAIRSATLNGAEYLGLDKQIGSLEAGKLADFVVMDKNPLEEIRNTESIIYTIINGRMYDASTMNEVGNYDKKRLPFYWENDKFSQNFPWHEHTESFTRPNCSCGIGAGKN